MTGGVVGDAPADPTRARVLLTSVPAHERGFAAAALPEALHHEGRFEGSLGRDDVRVLAVAVQDRPAPDELDAFPDLAAVVTRSDGYDHLPLDHLRRRGVAVYHLGDYAGPAVARLAVAFIVNLLRRVPEGTAETRGGGWQRRHLVGRDLPDVTVGILGVGKIGKRVAAHVAALGGNVIGFDVDARAYPEGLRRAGSLHELLAVSDVLTVHVPLDATTRGLLDEKHLRRLPAGALLVNTARGDLVDQEAVARLLDEGHLAGYAADVLPGEPTPLHLPFLKDRSDVLVTPHLAAYDVGTLRARYEVTAEVARAVLAGRPEAVAHLRVA